MQRIIPDGSSTGRTKMVTEAELTRRMAHRHDALRAWDGQAGVLCGDVVVHETPEATESHTDYPSYEKESEVGHLVMSGQRDAEWAYKELGKETPPL